jgi:type I restriction enzyme, S subunit
MQGATQSSWTPVAIRDITLKTKQRDPSRSPKQKFRYIDVSSVDNSCFRIKNVTTVTGAEAPSRARKQIQARDVIFATVRPTLQRIALVPPELDGEIASTGYCVLRCDAAKARPEFLFYSLMTDEFRDTMRDLERGASYPAVRDSDVLNTRIPLPALPEQRNIAAILSLVQRATEQQDRLLALTSELKKAVAYKLLTEGIRGEAQKQTEIGPVPESWDTCALGDLLERAQYGISVRGAESGEYAILRMTNQAKGRIVANNLQYVHLPTSEFERFRVKKNDILFNRTNSFELVGRTAIFELDGDYVFASYLIRLQTKVEALRPAFLNHYLNLDATQARLKSIASRAVSQSNISASRLSGFQIPVPSIGEQNRIKSILDRVDEKIRIQEQKRSLLQDLFRTLLHQLMTAQIRVNHLDLSEVEKLLDHAEANGA